MRIVLPTTCCLLLIFICIDHIHLTALTVHIDPELIVLTRLTQAYVYIPGLPYACEIYSGRNGEVIIIATGCMHGSYYYDLSGYVYPTHMRQP